MGHNAFGQKVMELCMRRGMNMRRAQKDLAHKLEAAGYGRVVKHVKHHINHAFQRKHPKAINALLFIFIADALELNESERDELMEALLETGRQALAEAKARKSVQPGNKMYEDFIPFYA